MAGARYEEKLSSVSLASLLRVQCPCVKSELSSDLRLGQTPAGLTVNCKVNGFTHLSLWAGGEQLGALSSQTAQAVGVGARASHLASPKLVQGVCV